MPKINRLILVTGASALISMMSLTGCQMMNPGGSESGGRTAGQVLDDKTITENVQHKLQNQPVYKFTDVGVKTYDGIVQLNGFVSTQDQKELAGKVAQSVDGVRQVINNLAMKPNANQLTPTGNPNNANQYQNGTSANQSGANNMNNGSSPANNNNNSGQ